MPIALKTPLGWTVHGLIREFAEDHVHVNFNHTNQERLNAQLERMHNEDFREAIMPNLQRPYPLRTTKSKKSWICQ